MSKKKSKKGKFKSGTWIEREMFTSRAFLSLAGFAPQMLVLFLGKRDRRGGEYINKNNLTMTYLELQNIFTRHEHKRWGVKKEKDGISAGRISRGFDDLLAKGFIEIKNHGGAFQQDKTIYSLSENWRFWQEGTVFSERPRDTRQRGFRKPKIKVTRENGAIHTRENGA